MLTLRDIAELPKRLVSAPGWTEPESDTGWTWFLAPLLLNGVVEVGLALFGGCYVDRPEVNVTIELRLKKPPTKKPGALIRLDWKSLKGGHSNLRRSEAPGFPSRAPPTHLHPFSENYLASQDAMRGGDLPLARGIDEELQSFEDVREASGRLFNITNVDLVTRPPWRYLLFHESP